MNKNTPNENAKYFHPKDCEMFCEKFNKIKELKGNSIQKGKGTEINGFLKIKCIVNIWIGE